MQYMPFMVVHDEVKDDAGGTYRYLTWAESPTGAARNVQLQKKEEDRPFPQQYDVFGLGPPKNMEEHEPIGLHDSYCTNGAEYDIDEFEAMFRRHTVVRL